MAAKLALFCIALSFFIFSPQARAQDAIETKVETKVEPNPEEMTLSDVDYEVAGQDYLHPSSHSLIGKYVAETGAKFVIRTFLRAPRGSQTPPSVEGPQRLVVALSKSSYPVFAKYFSSSHFLNLRNQHGNFVIFEGKTTKGQAGVGTYAWSGHVLDTDFSFDNTGNYGNAYATNNNSVITPILLDSAEGKRAEQYFDLARLSSESARYPWRLSGHDGPYCAQSGYAGGCGTWLGNMPLGNKLVDTYVFASGDDGRNPAMKALSSYELPRNMAPEVSDLIQKVWTLPGHQQLADMIDPEANKRGEFDNAGWTTYTFLGSASVERVPVVFLVVDDVTKEIDPNFTPFIDPVN